MSPAASGSRILADLHVHSTHSDGRYPPRQLCGLAAGAGLTHLALCDHDTLSGLEPMERALEELAESKAGAGEPPLVFLPGVELSTGSTGNTHVLGYGVQTGSAELQEALLESKARRLKRFQVTLERLEELGLRIPPELLPPSSGGPLGRAHAARALMGMGAVRTMNEAFDRYLGNGRPAYVPYRRMGTREAVKLLRRVGAVPVLAHPCRIGLPQPALFALVESLQEAGLQGLEVYHPSASKEQIAALEAYARRRGLLVTGGSDFHGDQGAGDIGKLPQGWHTQGEDVAALMACMSTAAGA
ncbi:MAG: PHP domain-containing protein [Candidatus Limiplasma sp.]|nr:PHP domain-containing protein [Candidatus Limiplasma sp.]